MGFERTRAYLLSLPRVEETLQWDMLVYWVLDKTVGGKMFATLQPEAGGANCLAFAVPPEHFHDLLETDGVCPAPYLARAQWVAVADWQVFTERELHTHLLSAYERVETKLPTRVQRLLTLSTREYKAQVREARAAAVRTPAPRRSRSKSVQPKA